MQFCGPWLLVWCVVLGAWASRLSSRVLRISADTVISSALIGFRAPRLDPERMAAEETRENQWLVVTPFVLGAWAQHAVLGIESDL